MRMPEETVSSTWDLFKIDDGFVKALCFTYYKFKILISIYNVEFVKTSSLLSQNESKTTVSIELWWMAPITVFILL